jgi:transposase, IS4 family
MINVSRMKRDTPFRTRVCSIKMPGFKDLTCLACRIMQPKKKPRNGTLTPQEKEENRRISSVRVRIEHVIGDIKRYRIIHDIIRYSCSEFRDAVMETCCGLHNFRMRLKRKKYAENQIEP